MKILAFDTSGDRVHIGVQHGSQQWAVDIEGGAKASQVLIGACLQALSEAGLSLRDLDAIAVGIGPGSFTGLRCAVSVAQGFAYAVQKPVLALPTLMALAWDAVLAHPGLPNGTVFCASTDARMAEVYWGLYQFDSNRLNEHMGIGVISPKNLALKLLARPDWHWAGSAQAAYPLDLAHAGTEHPAAPTGRGLLAAAQQLWNEGQRLKPEQAQPLYVRNNVAQTEAERAAEKSSTNAASNATPKAAA